MKTINPDIDIFNNLEKALKSFGKCETPCQLLEAKMGKKTYYFLDKSKEAIKEWPNLYKLISEKVLVVVSSSTPPHIFPQQNKNPKQ